MFTFICQELRRVRIKFGWTKAGRMDTKTDAATYAHDKEQMRVGTLRPADKNSSLPWNAVAATASVGWSEKDDMRIRDLLAALMAEFGVVLPKGTDEFTFFGHSEAMPEGWGSTSAYRWSCERYDTASYWCNWDDIVCDEPDGIYIEITLQVCVRACPKDKTESFNEAELTALRERYVELLGLPLVIESHNALRVSMGHAEHGRGMACGWALEPSSLADRTEDRNNTLFETTTTNNFKLDFPKKFYHNLIHEAINSGVRQEFAAPRRELPDIPASMAANLALVNEAEALNFEEVYGEGVEAEEDEQEDGNQEAEQDEDEE